MTLPQAQAISNEPSRYTEQEQEDAWTTLMDYGMHGACESLERYWHGPLWDGQDSAEKFFRVQ